MIKLLPKWVMRRYLKLRKEIGSRKFTFKEAQKALDDDGRIVSLFLSELNKAGWLHIEKHSKDARVRIYQIKELEKAIKEYERYLE